MRFFQRCFNRAEVKMEYSTGYSPHQKMSFAQPLGVGIISDAEFLDAEIAPDQDLMDICRRLNAVCGDGFTVHSVRKVQEGAQKAMAALQYASYIVDVNELLTALGKEESAKALEQAIASLLRQENILVTKTTKSGEKQVDIRPQIVNLVYENGALIFAVTAGSENNLKPDLLTATVFAAANLAYQRESVTIKRTGLFAKDFVSLQAYECEA